MRIVPIRFLSRQRGEELMAALLGAAAFLALAAQFFNAGGIQRKGFHFVLLGDGKGCPMNLADLPLRSPRLRVMLPKSRKGITQRRRAAKKG